MKSVLIIDKPENCGECPVCIFTADEKRSIGCYCKSLKRFVDYDEVDGEIDILTKPEDCPLRDLPQKEVANEYDFEHYRNGVAIGWNRCLEKITGESKVYANNT